MITTPLSPTHRKQLLWLAVISFGVLIPLMSNAWIGLSALRNWDIVFTARAASVTGMLMLTAIIATPFLLRHPLEQRLRGYIVFWICISIFFNLTWQLPLLLFKPFFVNAELTRENLKWLINWWGYGFCDSHYMQISPTMMSTELWFLLANVIGAAGLLKLRAGREAAAFLLLGLCAALQSYNASLYLVLNAIIHQNQNIADGTLPHVIYWGYGALWPLAAAIASVFAFRIVLQRAASARAS